MLKDLLDCMSQDTISTQEKTDQLKDELCRYYDNPVFLKCKSMGDLVKMSLKEMLRQNKKNFQGPSEKKHTIN